MEEDTTEYEFAKLPSTPFALNFTGDVFNNAPEELGTVHWGIEGVSAKISFDEVSERLHVIVLCWTSGTCKSIRIAMQLHPAMLDYMKCDAAFFFTTVANLALSGVP